MKKIILSLIALVISTGLLAQVQGFAVGEVVDDFTVTDTEGNVHNLYDITANGQYVYIDMFFVDCPPCQATVQYWNEFYDKYGCNQGELFMISINGTGDNDAEVIDFENQFGGSFEHSPAVSTIEGGGAAPDGAFDVVAYPTYFLIGPDNTLLINDIWPISSVVDFENSFAQVGISPTPMQCSLGLDDIVTTDFTIYPNPSSGDEINVTLSENTSQAQVIIYNVLGNVVYSNSFLQRSFTMSTDLSTGSYIVSIKTESGTINKSLVVK
ncbi:T9SS type A sorting domain-containing protein [Patiriisocius marinus]|uniref:T9SS type A sorting domain-containing protein n=1 Tax=Patiriisocius marinus TaxID=1397112 RepID=UPI00232D450F|nr:T9SS type A sorting domain-containing protein [Patiriisocius marinus]